MEDDVNGDRMKVKPVGAEKRKRGAAETLAANIHLVFF